MGILDIFREDDDYYEGSHSSKSRRSSSSRGKLQTSQEVLDWLQKNEAIVLSEDGGIVVFTDDDDLNFLNIYNSEAAIINEKFDSTAKFSFENLQDLLDELDDVSYVLYNSGTDDVKIEREEIVEGQSNDSNRNLDDDDETIDSTTSFWHPYEETEDKADLTEPEAFSDSAEDFSNLSDEKVEDEFDEFKEETQEIPSFADSEEIDNTDYEETEDFSEQSSVLPVVNVNHLDFAPVTEIPTKLLKALSSFVSSDKSVTTVNMGFSKKNGHDYYAISFENQRADFDASEIDIDTKEYTSLATKNDGNPLAQKVASKEFVVYEISESKGKSPKRNEEDMLDYISNHFLIFPTVAESALSDLDELITFTNFTHIPSQFLLAFDSFTFARPEFLGEFLEKADHLDFAHVNPFSKEMQIDRETLMMVDESRKRVLIVGLGLIGSSLALGIRRGLDKVKIVGLDKEETIPTKALKAGVIDAVADSLKDEARRATHIILATPIEETVKLIDVLGTLKLRKGVLITDTASTKQKVVAAAKEAFGNYTPDKVAFVGGHPMISSQKSSSSEADANLFENTYYIVTDENDKLKELLAGLHAKFKVMEAADHDSMVSQVSQLPHLLASTLALQTESYSDKHTGTQDLTADIFTQLPNLAEAKSDLWTTISVSNKDELLKRIEEFESRLDSFVTELKAEDKKALSKFFDDSKSTYRNQHVQKGTIESHHDLFVSIPDEKGAALQVLNALADYSIVNIQLNDGNRDKYGQLQLSFKSKADQEAAKDLLLRWTSFSVESN